MFLLDPSTSSCVGMDHYVGGRWMCVGGQIAMVRRQSTHKKMAWKMERLNILCQRMNRSMIFIWSNATGKRKKKLLRDNIMPIMLMWQWHCLSYNWEIINMSNCQGKSAILACHVHCCVCRRKPQLCTRVLKTQWKKITLWFQSEDYG